MKAFLIACMILCFASTAFALPGRRAVLYAEGQALLAQNIPYVKRTSDCSWLLWQLLKKVFPELRIYKWFRRTTCELMAGWPWGAVMSLDDVMFGDLLFTGRVRIKHGLMAWEGGQAIHSGSTRGVSLTRLYPYWAPRISVIVRPPY